MTAKDQYRHHLAVSSLCRTVPARISTKVISRHVWGSPPKPSIKSTTGWTILSGCWMCRSTAEKVSEFPPNLCSLLNSSSYHRQRRSQASCRFSHSCRHRYRAVPPRRWLACRQTEPCGSSALAAASATMVSCTWSQALPRNGIYNIASGQVNIPLERIDEHPNVVMIERLGMLHPRLSLIVMML